MRVFRAVLCLCGCVLLCGCAAFKPQPLGEVPFLERGRTKEQDGVRVTVSVLSREETRKVFGVALEKKRIQPVWIDIRNHSQDPYWFMLSGVDPKYFSAREAAYMFHSFGRGKRNRRMDRHFEDLAIDQMVLPGCRSAGFGFGHLEQGVKEVRVRLFGDRRVLYFEFHIHVPGLKPDWEAVDFDALVPEEEIVDIRDGDVLRERLEALPRVTTRKNGKGSGDPLNLVVIGDLEIPFSRAKWDQTERLTPGTAWKTLKGFFGREYKHAPMSSLYVFGRHQDIGLQKARDSIHERNHLRLWLAPFRWKGRPVWVGTITRDIGVYFTTRAWNLMTHAIDPNVDEARDYLTEDLAMARSLAGFGYLEGVAPATRENPHLNLMEAPYWTDGDRVILGVTDETVPLEDVENYSWQQRVEAAQCREPLPAPAGDPQPPAAPGQPSAPAPPAPTQGEGPAAAPPP